jgi:hypothetical protein
MVPYLDMAAAAAADVGVELDWGGVRGSGGDRRGEPGKTRGKKMRLRCRTGRRPVQLGLRDMASVIFSF